MTPHEPCKKAQLLAAYDEQLRNEAETAIAIKVTKHGPLFAGSFPRPSITSGPTLPSTGSSGKPVAMTERRGSTRPCWRTASSQVSRKRS